MIPALAACSCRSFETLQRLYNVNIAWLCTCVQRGPTNQGAIKEDTTLQRLLAIIPLMGHRRGHTVCKSPCWTLAYTQDTRLDFAEVSCSCRFLFTSLLLHVASCSCRFLLTSLLAYVASCSCRFLLMLFFAHVAS